MNTDFRYLFAIFAPGNHYRAPAYLSLALSTVRAVFVYLSFLYYISYVYFPMFLREL